MQVLSRQDPEKRIPACQIAAQLPRRRPDPGTVRDARADLRTHPEVRHSNGCGRPSLGRRVSFDRVTFNNRMAMTTIAEGLFHRGHRNILFIVHQRNLNVTQQRLATLEEVARKFPEKVAVNIMECNDQTTLTGLLSADMRKKNAPTALIVSNSKLATWAFRAFRALMISLPGGHVAGRLRRTGMGRHRHAGVFRGAPADARHGAHGLALPAQSHVRHRHGPAGDPARGRSHLSVIRSPTSASAKRRLNSPVAIFETIQYFWRDRGPGGSPPGESIPAYDDCRKKLCVPATSAASCGPNRSPSSELPSSRAILAASPSP